MVTHEQTMMGNIIQPSKEETCTTWNKKTRNVDCEKQRLAIFNATKEQKNLMRWNIECESFWEVSAGSVNEGQLLMASHLLRKYGPSKEKYFDCSTHEISQTGKLLVDSQDFVGKNRIVEGPLPLLSLEN